MISSFWTPTTVREYQQDCPDGNFNKRRKIDHMVVIAVIDKEAIHVDNKKRLCDSNIRNNLQKKTDSKSLQITDLLNKINTNRLHLYQLIETHRVFTINFSNSPITVVFPYEQNMRHRSTLSYVIRGFAEQQKVHTTSILTSIFPPQIFDSAG